MPVGPSLSDPQLLDDILAHLRAARSPGAWGQGIQDITESLMERATASVVVGEGAGEEAAALAAGESSGVLWAIAIVVVVIIIIFAFNWLEGKLRDILSGVPWKGGELADMIGAAFSPIGSLENWVAHEAVALGENMLTDIKPLFDFFIGGGAAPSSPHDASLQREVEHIQQELAHIHAFNSWVSHTVQTMWAITHGTKPVVATNDVPLNEQLHALQAQLTAIDMEINNHTSGLGALHEDITDLREMLTGINARVVGVRAVTAGIQDLTTQIHDIQRQVQTEIVPLQDQTNRNTSNIGLLLPLAVLTAPGAAGIDNLRALEDTPCLCPPQIPVPDVLSIYEFITNG